ncbi:hypothetical protein T01_1771 [Trichinella spiralis]|uniref:Uncharacterized protein n=1 Tax=Trichinella spiralis TaxID=6334 RepID=A0A0V1BUQ6_TRISP|nr:hypothetical protein T01_1771 [Trichinella spiralis]
MPANIVSITFWKIAGAEATPNGKSSWIPHPAQLVNTLLISPIWKMFSHLSMPGRDFQASKLGMSQPSSYGEIGAYSNLTIRVFTVTIGAAQADLSIGISTPMSTYRSNSFSTASCIVNANGKWYNSIPQLNVCLYLCTMLKAIFKHNWKFSAHVILCTRLNCINFLLICKERAKSFSCSECVDPILTHHIGHSVFGHSNNSFLVPVLPSTVTIVSPFRFTSCPVKLRNITVALFRFRLSMIFHHSGLTMVTAVPVSSSIRVDLPLILTVTSKLCARSLTA